MAEPIDPKYREQMNKLARALDETFNGKTMPKKTGFALFVFDFNDKTRVNYISNADRDDMAEALREWLERHA